MKQLPCTLEPQSSRGGKNVLKIAETEQAHISEFPSNPGSFVLTTNSRYPYSNAACKVDFEMHLDSYHPSILHHSSTMQDVCPTSYN